MATKTASRISISFRVTPRFKRCLELAAEREQRSQTNLVEKLVFDYCKTHGIEPSPEPVRASPPKTRKA